MTLKEVREFNTAFEVHMANVPSLPAMPMGVQNELYKAALQLKEMARFMHSVCAAYDNNPAAMRVHLMVEELGEMVMALSEENLPQVLHESCDMRVVNDGTLLVLGLGDIFHKGFNMVHEANMSKLGPDGKPVKNAVGRILKGPNFKAADLRQLVYEAQNKE